MKLVSSFEGDEYILIRNRTHSCFGYSGNIALGIGVFAVAYNFFPHHCYTSGAPLSARTVSIRVSSLQ